MVLSHGEINKALNQLHEWQFINDTISKKFTFPDFNLAFAFMTKVALIAEKMDHHPDWKNAYNIVEISLQTHYEGGITNKDIELAEEIDKII